MISKTVNVSMGPVGITAEVQAALATSPLSHRSPAFSRLYAATTDCLCEKFNVQKTFLLTGSGTLANEAMLWQIKALGGEGLILANGEFGYRLIEQANRLALHFTAYKKSWGWPIDLREVESIMSTRPVKWMLFCHCATSTGTVAPLALLSKLAQRYNCLVFVDCMSTVGTVPLDLSNVAMATASSGKGLAAVPGLAVVFSNIDAVSNHTIPVYLDLNHYADRNGIPFTLSSNLVQALNVSISQKLNQKQFDLLQYYGKKYYTLFNDFGLSPFSNVYSKVFTIVTQGKGINFMQYMEDRHIITSYQSEYLRKRNWCQLALLGYYEQNDLEHVFRALVQFATLATPARTFSEKVI